jgi:hypothetical protein
MAIILPTRSDIDVGLILLWHLAAPTHLKVSRVTLRVSENAPCVNGIYSHPAWGHVSRFREDSVIFHKSYILWALRSRSQSLLHSLIGPSALTEPRFGPSLHITSTLGICNLGSITTDRSQIQGAIAWELLPYALRHYEHHEAS